MGSKKHYYKLDDIGFVGTQEKRSTAQVKKDAKRTSEIIKASKAGKVVAIPAKTRLRPANFSK